MGVSVSLMSVSLSRTWGPHPFIQHSEVFMLILTTPHPACCPLQQPRKRCCFLSSLSAGSDETARWQRGFQGVGNRRSEEQAVNSFLENMVSGEYFIWWIVSTRVRKKDFRYSQGHRGGLEESQMINILLILHVCSFAHTCCMHNQQCGGDHQAKVSSISC